MIALARNALATALAIAAGAGVGRLVGAAFEWVGRKLGL